MHRPSVVCRLSPTGTSAWLPLDNTTDADPPRLFNWRSLHLTNTQPLTFSVVARTPLEELQAPTTGCSNPGFRPVTFVNETHSETALTRTIRTPLVPNGLSTTLLTVQNAVRRTRSSPRVSWKVDALTRLSTRSEKRCVPVRSTEPRDHPPR